MNAIFFDIRPMSNKIEPLMQVSYILDVMGIIL